MAHEATAQGRNLYEQMKGRTTEEAGTQSRRLADGIRQWSDELRRMSESAESNSTVASLVSRTADRGHDLARYLDQRQPGELLDDLQEFGRRRLGAFLAGAALVGFAVSRVGRESVPPVKRAQRPPAARPRNPNIPSPRPRRVGGRPWTWPTS
ncbi:hypothetical protein NKH77_52575 [Streptomyces sp. M19]